MNFMGSYLKRTVYEGVEIGRDKGILSPRQRGEGGGNVPTGIGGDDGHLEGMVLVRGTVEEKGGTVKVTVGAVQVVGAHREFIGKDAIGDGEVGGFGGGDLPVIFADFLPREGFSLSGNVEVLQVSGIFPDEVGTGGPDGHFEVEGVCLPVVEVEGDFKEMTLGVRHGHLIMKGGFRGGRRRNAQGGGLSHCNRREC